MKRLLAILLSLVLLVSPAAFAEESGAAQPAAVDYATLLTDLLAVWTLENAPAAEDAQMNLALARAVVDKDLELLNDPVADAVADIWDKTYLDPGFTVLIHGQDDPAGLPVSGKHAFVVLGYQLENGEMTDELKARCEAAAEAAKAFPDSILVCSGGATGTNNPKNRTEAGLMKAYLTGTCGIDASRIFTDTQAMDTVENAVNTFRILKENGIERITLVTSSYHQKRATVLYGTLAAITQLKDGYTVELAGNFSNFVEAAGWMVNRDAAVAAYQLNGMLAALLPAGAE